MADTVASVTAMVVAIPRDEPYLGALRGGEEVNAKGYFVRRGNDTLYPTVDRSVLVRIECASGAVGWGETYGLVAPRATVEIIEDVLIPFLIGGDPLDRECIHDRLYDLIRMRGYTGGFYLDALAAIDIALWDLAGRLLDVSVATLLGGRRRERLPAYVSGLPTPNLDERIALAQSWVERGFDSFKFAAPMAGEGTAKELAGLRRGLGPDVRIACDMHWMHTAATATAAIKAMESDALWFAEAPVRTEDIDGLARVASAVNTPVAVGEEWRTVFDAQLRFARSACAIVQPEVGHTGITQFMRIANLAAVHHLQVIPHATVGIGVFLAASLQASAAAGAVCGHEYQPSIFESMRRFLQTEMDCQSGFYAVPDAAGLGVAPDLDALERFIER